MRLALKSFLFALLASAAADTATAQAARMASHWGYAVVSDDMGPNAARTCPAGMQPVDATLFLYQEFIVEVTDEFRQAAQRVVRLRKGTSLDGGTGDQLTRSKARSSQYSRLVGYSFDGKRQIGSLKACLASYGLMVKSGRLYIESAAVNYVLDMDTTIQRLSDPEHASVVFNYETDVFTAGTPPEEKGTLADLLRGDDTRWKRTLIAADYPNSPKLGTLRLRSSTPGWTFKPLKAGERPITGSLDLHFRFNVHRPASTP